MTLVPTVFLDRDGVIIKDGDYLFNPDHVALIPGAGISIARLRRAGYLVICITNQSGVARQKTGASILSVDACNRKMQELLYREDPEGSFLDIRYSPHGDDDGVYRKPATGLIEPIKPWIDVKRSFFIGDRQSDLLCGENLGLPREHCLWVKSGKPSVVTGYPAFSDINEAVLHIVG